MPGQMHKTDYDVVVVGARCAGAATARLLARAGLDVLLLDRTVLPADTVSTHALMLGAVVQLRRWGLLDAVVATGSRPVDGIDIHAGEVAFTGRVKHIGGVDRLYAPRRITLDAILADAAVAAGAELVVGATVTECVRDDSGRVVGVAGTRGDGAPFDVRARWVVGADGVRSTVARLVAPAEYRYDAPTNACHYAYWSGLASHRYEFSFAEQAGAGLIPTDGDLTLVYANCPVDRVREVRSDLERGFHRIVESVDPAMAERVRRARRVTGFRGMRGLPSFLRQPWGRGWLLVGDAAYHRDPYSAHGITDAFRDAELAAQAIVAAAGGSREIDAMVRFHLQRDDFAVPMYESTLRLASYEIGLDGVLAELSLMGEEGEREARFLAALPPEPRANAMAVA